MDSDALASSPDGGPRWAIVTGGSIRGGLAISRWLHARGLGVVVHHASAASAGRAQDVVDGLNAQRPGSALRWQAALEDHPAFPHTDLPVAHVVCNASRLAASHCGDLDEALLDFRVHVSGHAALLASVEPSLLGQAVSLYMLAMRGGSSLGALLTGATVTLLGVRHALRSRGVVLVQGPRNTNPFDTYTDRKLVYHLSDGAPDPAQLEADIKRLAELTRATLDAWHERTVSPVYSLLPNLVEPDWKSLRVGGAREYWERYDDWAGLIERARKANHPEDILVLADEAPVTALRVEARIKAGKALLKSKHFNFALEQFELACEFDPANIDAARSRGMCLQRLGRADDARALYMKILAEHTRFGKAEGEEQRDNAAENDAVDEEPSRTQRFDDVQFGSQPELFHLFICLWPARAGACR